MQCAKVQVVYVVMNLLVLRFGIKLLVLPVVLKVRVACENHSTVPFTL